MGGGENEEDEIKEDISIKQERMLTCTSEQPRRKSVNKTFVDGVWQRVKLRLQERATLAQTSQ